MVLGAALDAIQCPVVLKRSLGERTKGDGALYIILSPMQVFVDSNLDVLFDTLLRDILRFYDRPVGNIGRYQVITPVLTAGFKLGSYLHVLWHISPSNGSEVSC